MNLYEDLVALFLNPWERWSVRVLSIECINLVLEEALQRGAQCYKRV